MMVGSEADPGQFILVVIILVSGWCPPALLPENKPHRQIVDLPSDGSDFFKEAHGSIMISLFNQIKSHVSGFSMFL
jgi:hypothetical protein